MKILQLNAFHYRKGGSEAVYFNTTRLLEEHGHEVVNFALKWPENIESSYSDFFPESKGTRRGVIGKIKNIFTYYYHVEAAANLKALIEREKPDIAHVHLIWGQLTPSVLRVLRAAHVPVVLTTHDYRIVCPASVCRNGKGEVCEQCEGHKFFRCIANNCCKGSKALSAMMASEQYLRNALFNPAKMLDGIIYVSDFVRNMHEKYMPALKKLPSVRIYNFTDHQDAGYETKSYFLYFGRLSSEKGIKTLLSVAAHKPDVKFVVAGTGPQESDLKSFVSHECHGNVEFVGYKSGLELQKLVGEARFVVVPSECYENNPLSIIESYAVGTPVIGAEIGGIPEIIEDGVTGFIFKAGDKETLADKISQACRLTPAEYNVMCNACRKFADRNFSPEANYSALMTFYDSVIKSSRS